MNTIHDISSPKAKNTQAASKDDMEQKLKRYHTSISVTELDRRESFKRESMRTINENDDLMTQKERRFSKQGSILGQQISQYHGSQANFNIEKMLS